MEMLELTLHDGKPVYINKSSITSVFKPYDLVEIETDRATFEVKQSLKQILDAINPKIIKVGPNV